jgi:hypothetical protein
MNQEKCRKAIDDLKVGAKKREDFLLVDFALLLEELLWPTPEEMAAPAEPAPPEPQPPAESTSPPEG